MLNKLLKNSLLLGFEKRGKSLRLKVYSSNAIKAKIDHSEYSEVIEAVDRHRWFTSKISKIFFPLAFFEISPFKYFSVKPLTEEEFKHFSEERSEIGKFVERLKNGISELSPDLLDNGFFKYEFEFDYKTADVEKVALFRNGLPSDKRFYEIVFIKRNRTYIVGLNFLNKFFSAFAFVKSDKGICLTAFGKSIFSLL
jgi:hypothetical protein